MRKINRYNHTLYASYLGYITQAVVNNFVPLLFLTFSREFALSLDRITLLTTINFGVQLLVDLLSTKVVDRIGYRPCIVAAHLFAAAGLIGLWLLPDLIGNAYAGILLSVVLYAIGGGLIEVLISPIVEACPTERKEAAMSLLHSFYCWGHLAVILLSTLFFAVVGIARWRLLAVLWSLLPLGNAVWFLYVPLYPIVQDARPLSIRALLGQRVFWLLMLLMVAAGASEQAMSQWASAFAESALHVSKAVGDLLGPCTFALCMGIARALYGRYGDRLPLKTALLFCGTLCIGCYLTAGLAQSPLLGLTACALCGFSVGIFWPGTFSLAARTLPTGGTALFALMALAGDVGCSAGPTLVGLCANAFDGDFHPALLAAIVFPALILFGTAFLRKNR